MRGGIDMTGAVLYADNCQLAAAVKCIVGNRGDAFGNLYACKAGTVCKGARSDALAMIRKTDDLNRTAGKGFLFNLYKGIRKHVDLLADDCERLLNRFAVELVCGRDDCCSCRVRCQFDVICHPGDLGVAGGEGIERGLVDIRGIMVYQWEYDALATEHEKLSEKIRSIEDQKKDKADRRRQIEVFLRILEEQEKCLRFEPYTFVALVDKVVIRQDRKLEIIFRNGMKYEYSIVG